MPSVITVRPSSGDENCGWIFTELGGNELNFHSNDDALAHIKLLSDETVMIKRDIAGAIISVWWRKHGHWGGSQVTEAEADCIESFLLESN